jgi:hypothetical protein
MPGINQWEILKVLRTEFDDAGKAQGVQIRWCRTDRGNLTFSYSPGLVTEGGNRDGSDAWRAFKYIPDRYAIDYIKLLQEATALVRQAMAQSKRDEHGRVTAPLLESSVVSSIKRRRASATVG